MSEQPKPIYLFLDDEPERRQLIEEMAKVRRAVLRIVEIVPEAEHYEPRYHGWSLAAMLGHLHMADNFSLMLIQAALIGVHPRFPLRLLNRINNSMARVYRKRLVATSLKSIQNNEQRIAQFILRLPVSKFSRKVFHPNKQEYMTVERAIQDLFLYHWDEHLRTMQEVEGIQPSRRSDER